MTTHHIPPLPRASRRSQTPPPRTPLDHMVQGLQREPRLTHEQIGTLLKEAAASPEAVGDVAQRVGELLKQKGFDASALLAFRDEWLSNHPFSDPIMKERVGTLMEQLLGPRRARTRSRPDNPLAVVVIPSEAIPGAGLPIERDAVGPDKDEDLRTRFTNLASTLRQTGTLSLRDAGALMEVVEGLDSVQGLDQASQLAVDQLFLSLDVEPAAIRLLGAEWFGRFRSGVDAACLAETVEDFARIQTPLKPEHLERVQAMSNALPQPGAELLKLVRSGLVAETDRSTVCQQVYCSAERLVERLLRKPIDDQGLPAVKDFLALVHDLRATAPELSVRVDILAKRLLLLGQHREESAALLRKFLGDQALPEPLERKPTPRPATLAPVDLAKLRASATAQPTPPQPVHHTGIAGVAGPVRNTRLGEWLEERASKGK